MYHNFQLKWIYAVAMLPFLGTPALSDMSVPQVIPPTHPVACGIVTIFGVSALTLAIVITRASKAMRLSLVSWAVVLFAPIGFLPTALAIGASLVLGPQAGKYGTGPIFSNDAE
jgi:hypothetical protein